MPIRYSIDRVNKRLLTRADGVVTFHDINAHLDYEQRNRDLDRPELIDARGATTTVTADQVRQLVTRAVGMLRIVDLTRWMGVGWLIHAAWDIAHHLWGNPIWPFRPSSAFGCMVFDSLIAVWFLAGAPALVKRPFAEARAAGV